MKLPSLVTALALAAGGLVALAPGGSAAVADATGADARSATARTASTVRWGRCSDASLRQFKAQCAFVSVPLDYSKPGGTKIKLAVSRVRHTSTKAKYQGVMLVNPGGPGGSGLGLSVIGPIISQGFGRKDAGGIYDWIGFDPRGVGSSKPALSCDPNYQGADRPDYIPTTPALYKVWVARSKHYAAACGKAGGRLLAHMRTTDAARDMDSIRTALGASTINYYGYSYGTYLGQVYTKLFPQRMRRMVLDSNVDPRNVWYQGNLDQNVAFQRAIGLFYAWIAKHDASYHLGTTPAAVLQRSREVRAALAATPYAGTVGPDEWEDVILQAGYAQFLWPELASAFSAYAIAGDGTALVSQYKSTDSPGDDNGLAVYNAVSCVDGPWKNHNFLGDMWASYYRAPFLTWGNAWFNAPCNFWPAKASTPTVITGAGVGQALLVDETLDAATPYAGSLYLRSIFRQSRLIATVGGSSHAVSPSGNPCVDNKIFAYLATGKLPARKAGAKADVSCAPLPQPDPVAPTAFLAGPGSAATNGSNLAFAKAAAAGDAQAGRLLIARLLLAAHRY